MTRKIIPGRLAALGVLAVSAACSNPVSPGTHIRPDGFVITHAGEEFITGSGGSVTGQLQLEPGQTLGPVTVEFRDGAAPVSPPPDYFLEIRFADQGVATFTPTAPGAFTGTFHGTAAGSTTMRVRWMHGNVGSPHAHPDFESPPVQVVVAAGG